MDKLQKINLEKIKKTQKIIDKIEELNHLLTPSSDSSLYKHNIEPIITKNGIIGAIK